MGAQREFGSPFSFPPEALMKTRKSKPSDPASEMVDAVTDLPSAEQPQAGPLLVLENSPNEHVTEVVLADMVIRGETHAVVRKVTPTYVVYEGDRVSGRKVML
jgi:hypothetical protein